MKKFSLALLASVFMFSTAVLYAQNENANVGSEIEVSETAPQETSAPAAAPVTSSKTTAPTTVKADKTIEIKEEIVLTEAQKSEAKQNAAMIKRQAKELTDNAKIARKKAEADAKVIKTQAKNDEKIVSEKVATMK